MTLRPKETPETEAAVMASNGQWSFVLRETCERLERERDEARMEAKLLRVENNHNWQANDLAEQAFRERDEALQRVRVCGQHMIQVCEELDAREGDLALDAAGRAMARLRRAEQERDEAREAVAKWESSFDAMERAGAEQARRADENREWALRAEQERDEAREQRDLLVRALDECMVVSNLGVFNLGDDAKVALHKICCWEQEVGAHYAKEAAK